MSLRHHSDGTWEKGGGVRPRRKVYLTPSPPNCIPKALPELNPDLVRKIMDPNNLHYDYILLSQPGELYSCLRCGSVVSNMARHNAWHHDQAKILNRLTGIRE